MAQNNNLNVRGGFGLLDIHLIIWLFPIIFMFHDFEEIIFIKPWFAKNRNRLKERFPKIAERLLPHTDTLTTSSLSLGVSGMFILICVVTITAYITGWYYIWFGVFFVFTAHLFIHCFPGIIFMSYVPAIVTSIICLPVCCYMIVSFLQFYEMDFKQAVIFCMIGIVLMAITRLIMQIVMQKFDRWLVAYHQK
jgi:hypothetical protein